MTMVHRGIAVRLFNHPKYRDLTPTSRLLFLTLKLGPHNNYANLYELYPEVAQTQSGLSPEEFSTCMEELESKGWIKYRAPIVWIVNGLDNEWWEVQKGNTTAHIQNILRTLNRNELIDEFRVHYGVPEPDDKKKKPKAGKATSEEALPGVYWDKVVRLLGKKGGVSVRISPWQIMAAIHGMGGWLKLGGMSRSELATMKKTFVTAYYSVGDKKDYPDHLPGTVEANGGEEEPAEFEITA